MESPQPPQQRDPGYPLRAAIERTLSILGEAGGAPAGRFPADLAAVSGALLDDVARRGREVARRGREVEREVARRGREVEREVEREVARRGREVGQRGSEVGREVGQRGREVGREAERRGRETIDASRIATATVIDAVIDTLRSGSRSLRASSARAKSKPEAEGE